MADYKKKPAVKKKSEEQIQQEQEEQLRKIRTPRRAEGELFGVIIQMHGAGQVKVLCEDEIERNCRIPGKMKKRTWMRERDLVIVKPWDFQTSKADVVWRYLGFQVEHLKRRGLLDKLPVWI